MDESAGIPWTKWCVGGKTNIVLNCIDRHKDKELFNDTFIFSEKENGETSSITYQDFDKKKLPLMLGMINAIIDDKKLELDWQYFN